MFTTRSPTDRCAVLIVGVSLLLAFAFAEDRCFVDLESAYNSLNPHPQLSTIQALWISTAVKGAASSKRRPLNFLVWGAGFDSTFWRGVNCRGRTAFLETHSEWLEKFKKLHPGAEAYLFNNYTVRVDTSERYLSAPRPRPVKLPPQVEDTCWDVVLIDAPRGYSHKHPGRAEAAVWTAAMSARCQRSRALRSTLVFLHDVDRPVEKLILQKVFTTAAWTRIGTVNTPGHDCGEMACKPLSAFT